MVVLGDVVVVAGGVVVVVLGGVVVVVVVAAVATVFVVPSGFADSSAATGSTPEFGDAADPVLHAAPVADSTDSAINDLMVAAHLRWRGCFVTWSTYRSG